MSNKNRVRPILGNLAAVAAVAETPAEVAETPAVAPKSKAPKSASSRLVFAADGEPDGNGPVEAVILGYETKDGWVVSATTFTEFYSKGKKRAGKRGSTVRNLKSINDVRAAISKIEKAFIARGWTKPEVKPLGLVRKDDAFDLSNLPAPAKAKK